MSGNLARGFLQDIIAHPDDDTPRLVYADWLSENGDDERADFIRVQLERARLPGWDARQVRLRLREAELLERHGAKWKGELPTIKGLAWGQFRRGFVGSVTFSSFAALKAGARACWAAAPVEAVSVCWPKRTDKSGAVGPIAGLRELGISAPLLERQEAARLADSPLLSTVRVLTIADGALGAAGFRRLCASPHLGNLEALRLPANSIGDAGLDALFNAASLTSLEELDLSEESDYGHYGEDPVIDAPAMERLAEWPGLARLRSLTLSGNDFGEEGLSALLGSPHAAGLKELVIRSAGLFEDATVAFLDAAEGLRLEVLDVGENFLDDGGAEGLAGADCLAELKVLNLDRCEMGPDAARRLARAAFLPELRKLNVDHNSFGAEGLAALLKKKPAALHTLGMVDNDLGDDGAARLAKSPGSDSLLEVDLGDNELGARGAEALGAAKHLRNLLVLRLKDNPIPGRAAEALRQSPLGQRLAVLQLAAGGKGMSFTQGDDVPF